MPRGRPPKPAKIKRLEGNPGLRPIKQEPEPVDPVARPPDFVTGAAAAEWQRAVGAMAPGFFTAADVPVLTVYALAWVMYRNALAMVAREGMTARGSMGQTIPHPQIAVAAKQAELILRASDRLGMSPVARARLEAPDDRPPPSKFGGLMGGQLRLVR